MKRNLVTRRNGNLLCLRETAEDPSDFEWNECLTLLKEKSSPDPRSVRVLVVTDGGGPSPEQRKRLAQALEGMQVRIAVCTESIRTRFVVSSVALISSKIKAFGRTSIDEAYDYLDLDSAQRRVADRNIREMTGEIGAIPL